MITALITGSGSEENSWAPIIRALKTNYSYIPEDDANAPFANLIFQLRWLKFYSSFLKLSLSSPIRSIKRTLKIRKEFHHKLKLYWKLKQDIVTEIMNSVQRKELRLRSYLNKIESKYFTEQNIILTTNWDRLLEEKFRNQGYPILHIHGSVNDFHSLYLPSEVIEEPYRENKTHATEAGQAMVNLGLADRVLFYGLSMNTLDIELSFIISDAFSDSPRPSEIIIFDKYPDIIEQRLRLILHSKNCSYKKVTVY